MSRRKRAKQGRSLREKLKRAATSDATIDTAAVGIGAGLAAALVAVGEPVAGVLVTAATATLADLMKRLTNREASRVATVVESAAVQIMQRVADGNEPRADIDAEEAQSLMEGVLLQARRSYEEKKVPLLANLLATAPFTGTPLVNLISALAIMERLTYRQICIMALIPGLNPAGMPPLKSTTMTALQEQYPVGEIVPGVLADLTALIQEGLIYAETTSGPSAMQPSQMVLSSLRQNYPAQVFSNAARIRATIPEDDLAELRTILIEAG